MITIKERVKKKKGFKKKKGRLKEIVINCEIKDNS